MDHGAAIPYLRETIVFLAVAGIVVPIFHRLRISPILGFLLVGLVIGPYGAGRFVADMPWLAYVVIYDVEAAKPLADLGVTFLLFTVGLELSLRRLWTMRRLVFGLGGLQVALSAALVALVALADGLDGRAAVVVGLCLAMSSTAIVIQLLSERRMLASHLGRMTVAILLFQDLAVVPIIVVVETMATGSEEFALVLAIALAEAAAAVAAILLLGRIVLRPLFRRAAATRTRELVMAMTLLSVLAIAAITATVGLSMALGALLAGLLLSESEFRHEVETDIEPFKGLLLGLFFLTVGMGIDLAWVAAHAAPLILGTLTFLVIKGLIVYALSRATGASRSVSVEAGFLLGQAGEFAFIVAGLGVAGGVLSSEIGQFVFVATGLGMMATPLLAVAGRRFAAQIVERAALRNMPEDATDFPSGQEGHIIVAGFGRVGQTLGAVLDAERIPYVALDLSADEVTAHRTEGHPVYYGNVTRRETLERIGAAHAQALVLTVDSDADSESAVRIVRRHWPLLPIFARARDAAHARRLLELGATNVVPETIESSLQLAARVLEGVGTPAESAQTRIDRVRDAAQRAIREPS